MDDLSGLDLLEAAGRHDADLAVSSFQEWMTLGQETEVDRRTAQLRRAKHEVKLQEQRFRTLAQASPLGILYADETGSFAYCNANAEALLGRSSEDLIDHRWLEDLDSPGRQQLEASIRKAASGDSDAMCEYELLRPDGSTVWI